MLAYMLVSCTKMYPPTNMQQTHTRTHLQLVVIVLKCRHEARHPPRVGVHVGYNSARVIVRKVGSLMNLLSLCMALVPVILQARVYTSVCVWVCVCVPVMTAQPLASVVWSHDKLHQPWSDSMRQPLLNYVHQLLYMRATGTYTSTQKCSCMN